MNIKETMRQTLLGLLLALPLITSASASEDWEHQRKLVIDTSSTGVELKSDVAQMPLMLRLHSGNFAFAEAAIDGADLRFFAADGKTPLHHHFEKFDAVNELAIVWIQLPKIAANGKADPVVVRWGNAQATSAADAKATYDSTQLLDLHFADTKGDRDSTGNGNHATEFGATIDAAGPIGNAALFDGKGRLLLPASPTLKVGAGGFTYTAWIKPAAGDGTLYRQSEGKRSLSLELKANTLSLAVDGVAAAAKATLKPEVWQHVAAVAGNGKLALYIDGAEVASGDFALPEIAGEATIGDGYRGEMDEVALAATPRSADYVRALAASQSADALLASFADEEEEGEGASYVGILLGALTVDGWVVICILAVMGTISFGVMIGKTLYLARTGKANAAFINNFRDNSRKLLRPESLDTQAALADADLRHSTIFRLYKIGIEEMKQRFAIQSGNAAERKTNLSAAALNSIRAAMDAGMVRENQRLNSQIVLLTIAISGGPFLGLLGTVVGVMITFAAIAAAGDVNVNSIAPGIAAALVATVAGLAVAIPALFGYNWLSIQIKNVASDTQVFADEFLTKAAELHSA